MDKRQSLLNIFILFGVIVIIFGSLLFISMSQISGENQEISSNDNYKDVVGGVQEIDTETVLAGRKNDFPSNVDLGDSLSDLEFEKSNGEKFLLNEMHGQFTIVTFWASWCDYCKEQLEKTETFQRVLSKYDNVSIILVNALNQEKESAEQAEQYLSDQGIDIINVIDYDMKVYEDLGIRKLPTTLILSPRGRLLSAFPGKIDSASEFESMVSYTVHDYELATLNSIRDVLENDLGGIITSTEYGTVHPYGQDVLSESQGLIMEYAVSVKNKELFNSAYNYAENYLYEDGLFKWYSSEEGDAQSNAFLDDLRIYGALLEAQEIWGGYKKDIEEIGDALIKYNFDEEYPVDFFDFKQKSKSKEFYLCYADLATIQKLQDNTGSKNIYNNTKEIVEQGYISDQFPFYYSTWSYDDKEYIKEDLNMAEAMYTLYNLSKVGLLKEESENWILEQLKEDGIMARYNVDGTVVDGYNYESTGVYALVAMIGMEYDNSDIVTFAIARMNEFRIFDSSSIYDGAFGNPDGTGIYSFDQCMALNAYSMLDKYKDLNFAGNEIFEHFDIFSTK